MLISAWNAPYMNKSEFQSQDIRFHGSHSRLLASGFTLVEVLVALAVLTIALAAVMRALSQSIDTSASLRDRTVAMWVAQNRLTTHQIEHDFPALDTTEGDAEMAGRAWRWREQVVAAPGEPAMRQIHIEVRAASDPQPLARLIGFLSQ
jgi:general secretion pathway protein I